MAELKKRKEELNKNLQEVEKFKSIPIDNELKSDVVNITANLISSLKPFLEQLGQFQKTFLGGDKSDFISFKNYLNSRPDLLNLSDCELAKVIELYSKAEEDDSRVSNRFCCLQNDSCDQDIIKAHSIQENGELDIISDFIGN